MSMNQFMHPRNRYKVPPSFTELAIEYPEFRAVSNLEINGKVTLNFKDENTLRTLTKCLLHKDFKLDVTLPKDKLIPTLPLRLNYILWIEDILKVAGITNNVTGIDIGCGASCIYGLLAAREHHWKMIALETNRESCGCARTNIEANNLDHLIEVIYQDDPGKIFSKLNDRLNLQPVDFCICNPPFFSKLDELSSKISPKKNRTGHRPSPRNGRTGMNCELIVDGGECDFVQKIIEESCQLKDQIKVYTTMLGHKSSVDKIIRLLSAKGITNFCQTEFCQGHTTRWGIAWTFHLDIYLKTVPSYGQNVETNKAFTHVVDTTNDVTQSFQLVEKSLLYVDVKMKDVEFTNQSKVTFKGIAPLKNTWSKQRQRRRELDRQDKPHLENEINAKKEVCQIDVEDQASAAKKRKLNESSDDMEGEQFPFLVFQCSLENSCSVTHLHLKYLYGKGGKDGVYQIYQFLINRLK
ncbi:U6 small nuclear RNA (adenine-(43)-N(6))-methyltransferase [Pseudolycoriella hygida]|uniref:U6 small nuclear RNA (adenine-(43)-N(6))-methyltransferase n=1 Tax=Pseudolycoriella hygida TaxID=35572 RepID=A0A9Q0S5V6_9DIPT|nr:U6 small nuclear RNA (adenine-(43)-N(6))-methyltransferase [Pseudolycoriella hygida]